MSYAGAIVWGKALCKASSIPTRSKVTMAWSVPDTTIAFGLIVATVNLSGVQPIPLHTFLPDTEMSMTCGKHRQRGYV